MGQPMIHIARPGDPTAEKWLRRYEEYDEVRSSHSAVPARMYAWLNEPDVWVMSGVTVVMSGLVLQLPLVPVIVIGAVLIAYWLWACNRTPRVVRMYRKLSVELRILHMSQLMLNLYTQELPKLEDRSQIDEETRYIVLKTVLTNYRRLVSQVENDCGCQSPCYHPTRLGVEERRGLRRKLRKHLATHLRAAAAIGSNPVKGA